MSFNKEALERLILVLDGVECLNFNLVSFFDAKEDGGLENQTGQPQALGSVPDCGYTACAVGHAGMDKWFISRGLETDPRTGAIYFWPVDMSFGIAGWNAVKTFFGLSDVQSLYLFSPDYYRYEEWRDTHAVVKRIQDFIKTYDDQIPWVLPIPNGEDCGKDTD